MASESKSNGGSGGGFRARMLHYLYSGERKHVLAGMAIITVVFGAPWFLKMNKGKKKGTRFDPYVQQNDRNELESLLGTKHQSHQDYMEKADKARRERLSSSK